jgi:hypothetical protein
MPLKPSNNFISKSKVLPKSLIRIIPKLPISFPLAVGLVNQVKDVYMELKERDCFPYYYWTCFKTLSLL